MVCLRQFHRWFWHWVGGMLEVVAQMVLALVRWYVGGVCAGGVGIC